ncbi:MAG: O-antigen ligase family protein, partial [Pirellulaceae bacterium]|nr:O-antigen ligase family protein [Pirellulaceae bacterium]
VHGLHQQWISLPANRAEYTSNPDRLLRMAGIDAPPGSAERMVFENRLFDGGPTGTFALANSLAAVLVVGCVIGFGVLRTRWTKLSTSERVAIGVALLLGLGALWAARSRSAMAACLLGCVVLTVAAALLPSDPVEPNVSDDTDDSDESAKIGRATADRRSKLRLLMTGMAGLFVSGLSVGALIAAVGNQEWFSQAPASIAFRFQYWRSTFKIAADHPFFGSGPGNFQAMYERYREPSANEQIADPHNFLFETLASGGFVGLGLLLMLLVLSGYFAYQRMVVIGPTGGQPRHATVNETAKWVWLGSGLTLIMIWLIGAAAGRTPDIEAHLFVIPLAIAAAYFVWPALARCHSSAIDLIATVALGSLLLHLFAAGGWTVPGVAIFVWVFAAMLTRANDTSRSVPTSNSRNARANIAVVVAGVGLLGLLNWMSLRPVQAAERELNLVQVAQQQRRRSAMDQAMQRAVAADSWAVDAVLLQSEMTHWELILTQDSTSIRQRWESQIAELLRRSGEDPAVYRLAALQHLHVYQRWGNPADLSAASDLLTQAGTWSPSNQWIAAQRSAIAAARGDGEQARKLAHTAAHLAQLGGNIERSLTRQMLYRVQMTGPVVEKGPSTAAASDLLANQLDSPDVTTQN